jgi:hypothetical protein
LQQLILIDNPASGTIKGSSGGILPDGVLLITKIKTGKNH